MRLCRGTNGSASDDVARHQGIGPEFAAILWSEAVPAPERRQVAAPALRRHPTGADRSIATRVSAGNRQTAHR
jgi:hypothetical protein